MKKAWTPLIPFFIIGSLSACSSISQQDVNEKESSTPVADSKAEATTSKTSTSKASTPKNSTSGEKAVSNKQSTSSHDTAPKELAPKKTVVKKSPAPATTTPAVTTQALNEDTASASAKTAKDNSQPSIQVSETNKAQNTVVTPLEETEIPVEKKVVIKTPPKTHTEDGKLMLGHEEWIYIPSLKQSFEAHVDDVATSSSLSVSDIISFERNGSDWVKFSIQHNGVTSEEIALPIQRWVKIKKIDVKETESLPVVKAWVEIGGVKEEADFTLVNSKQMQYPVLLGRNFYHDLAIVDNTQEFIQPKKQ
ncbi:ATP-dependent zinc protease [Vibrio sp.]|nr:ATP-dependent zinc protease [Vibrio sp.]